MKTKFILLVLAAWTSARLAAAEAPGPTSCCAAATAKPSCCAEKAAASPPVSLPKSLSARSLYQLDAKWTNDASTPISLATLRGRPVVIAMFFASCEYACPVLVGDMQRVRAALPSDVRAKAQFVLVSFDTARDSSAALKEYRARMSLDASWTLLRGEEASVQELAMLLGVRFKQDARGQFSHSNLITVLNPEGEISYQKNGLMGDVSDAVKAIAAVTK